MQVANSTLTPHVIVLSVFSVRGRRWSVEAYFAQPEIDQSVTEKVATILVFLLEEPDTGRYELLCQQCLLAWIVPEPSNALTATIVLSLLVFGAIFAVNSALHSFLILSFTDAKRVTMDVGLYYMPNASGRFVGTVLSGFTYQLGGLLLCLGTAAVMIGLS